jgi:hypothetical protein
MNALAYALAYALAPRVEPPRLVVPEPPARGDDALGPRRCVSSMRSSAANGSVSGARRLAAPLREGALGVDRLVRVHGKRADVLGVQHRARRVQAAELLRARGGARAPRLLHARARGVRERGAGDGDHRRHLERRVDGGERRQSRRRAWAARALHLGGGGAGERERRDRLERGVDKNVACNEQTEAFRGFDASRLLHARDERAVARGDGHRARRARRVDQAARRDGAALHLHRVRRRLSRGRGVERGCGCFFRVVSSQVRDLVSVRANRRGARREARGEPPSDEKNHFARAGI